MKWLQAAIQDNRRHPVSTGGHRPSVLTGVRDWLLHLIDGQPDLTLEEICIRLQEEQGLSVWPSMLHYFFKREGISFKKTVFASEQDRPDIAYRRKQWKKCQGKLDPERLMFIDEMLKE